MQILCDGSCGCKAELVRLTAKEQRADDLLDDLLDSGMSLIDAVNKLRHTQGFMRISKWFWAWKLGMKASTILEKTRPLHTLEGRIGRAD